MADDARSLLRQQRAARRIVHLHAAYSDAGKLLCTLCREHVKAESLWDAHLKGDGHRKRAQAAAAAAASAQDEGEQQQPNAQSAQALPSHKRKHLDDDDGDEDMADDPDAATAAARRKRSRRPEDTSNSNSNSNSNSGSGTEDSSDAARPPHRRSQSTAAAVSAQAHTPTRTPPSLARRPSATPSQGVELQIPSRPATPRDSIPSSTSSAGTANGNGIASATSALLPSRQVSSLVIGPPLTQPGATAAAVQPPKNGVASAAATNGTANGAVGSQQAVDEDEWAAFEADIAATSGPSALDFADATISAAAMTAEESAAAAAAASGDQAQRTSQQEADVEGEREDATRALEEELDEMRDLEAKVLRLKQRRDALRQRAASHGQDAAAGGPTKPSLASLGKENLVGSAIAEEGPAGNSSNPAGGVDEEDEDEDEDDDEDDWDGFRFRTGLVR
jgi:zinc finger protein 830